MLDYLKSKFSLGRGGQIEIPAPESVEIQQSQAPVADGHASIVDHPLSTPFPWRSLLALSLALAAQRALETPHPAPDPAAATGVALYLIAFATLCWAILRREWSLAPLPESESRADPLTVRWLSFLLSIFLLIPAFILLGGAQITPDLPIPQPFVIPQFFVVLFQLKSNLFALQDNMFTRLNVILWLTTLGLFVWSLWLSDGNIPPLLQRTREIVTREYHHFHVSRWTLLILAASAVVIFFRVYHIQQTPAEPFSDHAAKR